MKKLFTTLEKMISRRHNIVHNADRNYSSDRETYSVMTIKLTDVKKWKNSVDKLVLEINKTFI